MPSLRSTRSADKTNPRQEQEEEEEEEQYDEELDEEDDEEAETRCICGQADPPDENGLFIQCEKCSVWQHGYCVSISDIVPEKYWCEICKPELHTIIIRPDRKMTKYLPVQPKETSSASNRRKNRRAASAGTTSSNGKDHQSKEIKKEDLDEAAQRKRRDRGAYSSREDARYEALIQRVMEESKKDASTTSEQEDEKSQSRSSRSSRRRQTRKDDVDGEEEENEENDENDKEPHDEEDDGVKKEFEENHEDEKKNSSKRKRSEEAPDSAGNANIQQNGPTDNNGSRPSSTSKAGKVSGESESNTESTSTKAKKRPKKAKTNHKSPQKDKDSTIDFNRPTKPRLPNQRTTMNEMRKRVAAILEFIGRTQVDIATEQDDKSELTKYVEDDVHKEKIEKLFENYNGSLELMDGLTRKLLIWEEKYGKLGEK